MPRMAQAFPMLAVAVFLAPMLSQRQRYIAGSLFAIHTVLGVRDKMTRGWRSGTRSWHSSQEADRLLCTVADRNCIAARKVD